MITVARRHRRGAQAVEFAMLAPVLVMLTGGVVDYSWYFSERQTVIAAARDGARAGAIVDSEYDGTPCSVAAASTQEALTASGLALDADGEISVRTVSLGGGDLAIEVEIDIAYTALMGLIPTPDRQVVKSVQRLEDQLNASCG